MLAPPLTLFVMIMGGLYVVPLPSIHVTIYWATWLSFARRYGYAALLIKNEYEGRDIPCATGDVTVTSIGTSGECPLPGEEVIAGIS
jgi:hypothetical protein